MDEERVPSCFGERTAERLRYDLGSRFCPPDESTFGRSRRRDARSSGIHALWVLSGGPPGLENLLRAIIGMIRSALGPDAVRSALVGRRHGTGLSVNHRRRLLRIGSTSGAALRDQDAVTAEPLTSR